jgi:hypothetical protein
MLTRSYSTYLIYIQSKSYLISFYFEIQPILMKKDIVKNFEKPASEGSDNSEFQSSLQF